MQQKHYKLKLIGLNCGCIQCLEYSCLSKIIHVFKDVRSSAKGTAKMYVTSWGCQNLADAEYQCLKKKPQK